MNLPNDVARCFGREVHLSGAHWTVQYPECVHCARRTAPLGEYAVLMDPPKGDPCPMRIADVVLELER